MNFQEKKYDFLYLIKYLNRLIFKKPTAECCYAFIYKQCLKGLNLR